jgi:hypothetical protein
MAIDKVLQVLIEAYPGAKLADNTLLLYARVLSDIPDAMLEAACLQHIASAKWFPTVAELREMALSLSRQARGAAHPAPMEAWGLVQREIGRTGIYRPPRFDDPLVAEAVELFGWSRLCNQPLDTIGVAEAHFSELYRSLVEREAQQARLLPEVRKALDDGKSRRKERAELKAVGAK